MSEQASAPRPVPQRQALPAMQVLIEGKVMRQRRHERKFYTVITTAAADQYSMPSTMEVRSEHQIAADGDIVKLICNVSGFVRQFTYKDDEGITRQGNKFTAFFDVIAG